MIQARIAELNGLSIRYHGSSPLDVYQISIFINSNVIIANHHLTRPACLIHAARNQCIICRLLS